MACINMFNPDHQGLCPPPLPPISPRISFSSDFAVEPPPSNRAPAGPADPDFEFSVGSHPMMAADQLFFKGRILPLKESPQSGSMAPRPMTTLREELQAHDDDCRPGPKGSVRWKELLGFKKPAHHSTLYKKGGASVPENYPAKYIEEEVPSDGGM
ncbi:uncharacterized protein LOC109724032 [Ananas comosus]|uniref:Uncharacterized protein LOC109724032 n=1 Tax=Ananas comosus TaxID=4615 RepID=A0A6P5GHU9_ANACO|nr:uncharacterized protein LOC109724032 [Ananas comosus]